MVNFSSATALNLKLRWALGVVQVKAEAVNLSTKLTPPAELLVTASTFQFELPVVTFWAAEPFKVTVPFWAVKVAELVQLPPKFMALFSPALVSRVPALMVRL